MTTRTKKFVAVVAATSAFLALTLPVAALALTLAPMPSPTGPLNTLALVQAVLLFIWILFVATAVIMFIIAGAKFLLAQGDPAEIQKARMFVTWGAVGIFVAILGFSIVWTIGAFFS